MLTFFLETFVRYSQAIVPWIILGMVIAVVTEKTVSKSFIKKYFGSFNYSKLFGAQVLGMVSPLSIMSFIPIARELVGMGANPGLLFSFFIAERAYDTQAFFIVASLFGIKMAVLNMIGIFVSLVVTAIYLKRQQLTFTEKKRTKKETSFAKRQIKLLLIVFFGITIGATLRTLIPETLFTNLAGSDFGGVVSALILGFSLYFGPLMGNYPVAKAFAELGMSSMGVLTFLTVSPIFNLVIMLIFSTMVGMRKTITPVMVYTFSSLIMSASLGLLFL